MPRTVILPEQREAEFQGQVLRLAELSGWLRYHTRDSRRSQPGFPDLVLVREPRLIFAELKRSEKEHPTPEQEQWLARLRGCPVEVYLWRPGDWDEIVQVLRR